MKNEIKLIVSKEEKLKIKKDDNIKFYLMLLCAYFVSIAGCSSNSEVSEKPSSVNTQTENPTPGNKLVSVVKTYLKDSKKEPEKLWKDGKATFTKPENIAALLVAGGASIAIHQDADGTIAEYFEKHGFLHEWQDETLFILGDPTTQFAACNLWYFLSAYNQDRLNKDRAWIMSRALTISWLTTWGLKIARDNESINGKDLAWPSSTASSSFTMASVLDEFYGPKVGIPAYTLASLVSYRMLDTGDHWGTDILFGATLGWVVGHTVAKQNKDLTFAGYSIVPYTAQTQTHEPAMGIGLLKRF